MLERFYLTRSFIGLSGLSCALSLILLIASDSQTAHRNGWLSCIASLVFALLSGISTTWADLREVELIRPRNLSRWYFARRALVVMSLVTLSFHAYNLAERVA